MLLNMKSVEKTSMIPATTPSEDRDRNLLWDL